MAKTAAILIVGNEILTGKIDDENIAFLARELFGLGVTLRRVLVVPDEEAELVPAIRELSAKYDFVFTSGGIGPTHDDITVECVAKAFERPLRRDEEMAKRIQGYWGDATTDAHLRMADVPEGAEQVRGGPLPWPTTMVENVALLPGVPSILQKKFEALRPRLAGGSAFESRAVYTMCDEGTVAAELEAVAAEHPQVSVGSYVRFDSDEYKVKVTVDGESKAGVGAAVESLLAKLDPDLIVRVE